MLDRHGLEYSENEIFDILFSSQNVF